MQEVNPTQQLHKFAARFPTQQAAAAALGISGPYLSDLLQGRRDVSDAILAKLGLRRIVVRIRKTD